MSRTRYAARTHPGRRSGPNEDAIGADEAADIWFVADGMGGHAAGKDASRIVKETLLSQAAHLDLPSALLKAHEAVFLAASEDPKLQGMGSTAVAARIERRSCNIAWVGDSRAYIFSRGNLRQLTTDHSFLEQLRAAGQLSDAELRSHPQRNLVTQTLGIGAPVPSQITTYLRHRDWLLLCSDGLNDELTDEEIALVLSQSTAPGVAADALVSAALAKGGRDNVSVIVIEYDGPSATNSFRRVARNPLLWSVLAGAASAIIIAFAWWMLLR